MFRDLKASEIECRVGVIKAKNNIGCSLLLYKDSRCDMNLLDETVGAFGWKREHSRDNRNCTVSIWDKEAKHWIPKEDTGTSSFTEAEKGLASDSFKRACFNWGIGRELYTAPFIWVKLNPKEVDNSKAKPRLVYGLSFSVSELTINDKIITSLSIIDNHNNNRFMMGASHPVFMPEPDKPNPIEKENTTPRQSFESFSNDHDISAFIDAKQDWSDQKKAAMKKSAATDAVLRQNILDGKV